MLEFKPIEITASHKDQSGLWDQVEEAMDRLEREVIFLMRLNAARSEDFYRYAHQVKERITQIVRHVRKVREKVYRDDFMFRARRAKHVVSFLESFGPPIEGSSVLGARTPREKIDTVVLGGLPGSGKRS